MKPKVFVKIPTPTEKSTQWRSPPSRCRTDSVTAHLPEFCERLYFKLWRRGKRLFDPWDSGTLWRALSSGIAFGPAAAAAEGRRCQTDKMTQVMLPWTLSLVYKGHWHSPGPKILPQNFVNMTPMHFNLHGFLISNCKKSFIFLHTCLSFKNFFFPIISGPKIFWKP